MALTQPDTPVAVAHIIVRYLKESASSKQEALLKRLAPLGGQQEKAARQTVSALVSTGVLVEDKEAVGLSDLAKAATVEPLAISDCLFANTDVADLWKEDMPGSLSLAGGIDLVRSLAWLLTLDAFAGPYSFDKGDSKIDGLQEQQLGHQVVANKERWLPFGRWASYLGFARLVEDRLSVDPTQALERILARAAKNQNSWTHQELVSLLATRLPVLDGGTFNESIRERQKANGMEVNPEAKLSSALSLALMVLVELRRVELDEGTGDASKARLAHGLGVVHRVRWLGTDGG